MPHSDTDLPHSTFAHPSSRCSFSIHVPAMNDRHYLQLINTERRHPFWGIFLINVFSNRIAKNRINFCRPKSSSIISHLLSDSHFCQLNNPRGISSQLFWICSLMALFAKMLFVVRQISARWVCDFGFIKSALLCQMIIAYEMHSKGMALKDFGHKALLVCIKWGIFIADFAKW